MELNAQKQTPQIIISFFIFTCFSVMQGFLDMKLHNARQTSFIAGLQR
jgi:hypothetical protein